MPAVSPPFHYDICQASTNSTDAIGQTPTNSTDAIGQLPTDVGQNPANSTDAIGQSSTDAIGQTPTNSTNAIGQSLANNFYTTGRTVKLCTNIMRLDGATIDTGLVFLP